MNAGLKAVLSTIPHADMIMAGLALYSQAGVTIGSTTALIPEANDANATDANIADGESGDVNFPHGNLKAIATGGERSVCGGSEGLKITGTPDGLGAYLANDETVRVVVQSRVVRG